MTPFNEFLALEHIPALPVDELRGFSVSVVLPPEWEPFDANGGVRLWISREHPRAQEFCPNAVLTLHRVQAALDPRNTFTMLCDQQRLSVPDCRELHRELADAKEGPGVTGILYLQIQLELGVVDSTTYSRILTTEEETLIAQLTVSALHDSPIDRSHIRLLVADDHPVGGTAGDRGGSASSAPVVG